MKTVKVSEELHKRLIELAGDNSIGRYIGGLLDGDSDSDRFLDQMHIRFDALELKLGSPEIFSEKTKEPSTPPSDESPEAKAVRLRLLEIEMKKSQQHAINHEEDCDQSYNWL